MGFQLKPKIDFLPKKVKQITKFPFYYINKKGQVWSALTKKWLRAGINNNGYLIVILRKNKRSFPRYIHRLVLETFTNESKNSKDTRHLNGNKKDNRLKNLEWGTRSQNELDKIIHGKSQRGEKHWKHKLTEKQVINIDFLYNTNKLSAKRLAQKFRVSEFTIWSIIHRKNWKYLWT